jgi:hypothetical protein
MLLRAPMQLSQHLGLRQYDPTLDHAHQHGPRIATLRSGFNVICDIDSEYKSIGTTHSNRSCFD